MHFIYLNESILLCKVDEIHYIAKLTDDTITGSSGTKLGKTVLSNELARFDRSPRGGSVACFVKNSISYNWKPKFYINTESIFMEVFLPKSEPVLIDILHRPPDEYDIVNCL